MGSIFNTICTFRKNCSKGDNNTSNYIRFSLGTADWFQTNHVNLKDTRPITIHQLWHGIRNERKNFKNMKNVPKMQIYWNNVCLCRYLDIDSYRVGEKRRLENHQIFCNTNYMPHSKKIKKHFATQIFREIDLGKNAQIIKMKGFASVECRFTRDFLVNV